MQNLIVEISEGVALVTLNRPEKLNALTPEMLARLTETFRNFAGQTNLRAVILTGAGSRAFCAGTDLSSLTELDHDGARATSERGQTAGAAIENCPVPVIAAINGLAAGGGFELALACHLRVAEIGVKFSLPETRLGLLPGYGGTQRLPRILGTGRGLELIIAGAELTDEEAHRIGLVNRIAPSGEALVYARALAAEIASLAPLAVRSCLKAVTEGMRLDLSEGLKLETELFADLFNSEDAHEGANAFLEKRAPIFTGR
ncbi:MAG: enoyl-CoA hydratase-related protein [Pyrinomonadaceae bacterium]